MKIPVSIKSLLKQSIMSRLSANMTVPQIQTFKEAVKFSVLSILEFS